MTKLIDREELFDTLESMQERIEEKGESDKFTAGFEEAVKEVEGRVKSLKLQDLEERVPVDNIAGVQLKDMRKPEDERQEFYSSIFERSRKSATHFNFARSMLGRNGKYYWLRLRTHKGYVLNLLIQEEEKNDE